MVTRRLPGLLLVTLLTVLTTSSTARAWTRSVVGGAQARIDLGRDATAHVLLRLDVEIQAGWLHELELAGLGADVVLDRSHPPYFRSEEGEIYRPEAEVDEEGRIHLSFSWRDAPKRGEYRVLIRYQSKVDATRVEVDGEPHARIVWSLPAWETGLHSVSIELHAPKGASIPSDSLDTPPGVDVRIAERPDGTVVEWRRIHLPRMTPWPLTIDVPAESFALPAAPDTTAPRGFKPLPDETTRPLAWALLAVAVLALLKRRSIERAMGPMQLLFRAPWALVLAITAAVLALGQWMSPDNLAWSLPLLALAWHRPVSSAPIVDRDDPWRPGRSDGLPPPKPLVGDFLDCTTGVGLTMLALGSALLFGVGQPKGALVLLPLFLCGTRHHAFPLAAESAELLRRFVSELRLPPEAPQIALGWEATSKGQSRVRLHLPCHRSGLCGLSFVVAGSTNGFVVHRRVVLLVETRAQSDADDLMRRRLVAQADLHKSNGVITRLIDWNAEALELVRALGLQAPKPVKTSRGTWLLHEISEPSKKAA